MATAARGRANVGVAVNEGTRQSRPYMEDSSKEYIATFKLGLLTTTLDLEGEVCACVVKELAKRLLSDN